MPRNSTGVYSLPAGNPVIPATIIATAWANPTMVDIANALTDSLDRDGRGGMRAGFKLFDGTIGTPGLGFSNEPSLGRYRSASGVMRDVVAGTIVAQYESGLITFINTSQSGPAEFTDTGSRSWQLSIDSDTLALNPSTTVDDDDWDPAKGVEADGDTGVFNFLQLPQSGGVDLALITDVDGVGTDLADHEAAVGDAVHGLGTISTQDSDAVNISGGNINGTNIGGSSVAAANVTRIRELANDYGTIANGGTVTLDWGAFAHHVFTPSSPDSNTLTIALSNMPTSGISQTATLEIIDGLRDADGRITYPGAFKWIGGSGARPLDTALQGSGRDFFIMQTRDGGTRVEIQFIGRGG